jgi:hypothetical protein
MDVEFRGEVAPCFPDSSAAQLCGFPVLLFAAIDRVTRIASKVGGVGSVVNAKSTVVDYYKRYGFE